MCIRDRDLSEKLELEIQEATDKEDYETAGALNKLKKEMETCLLYTSDAADERSSVDLGGRRIIKKKKSAKLWNREDANTETLWR